MAENRIQFQRGVSLAEFLKSYGTEAQCEAAVVEMRWPKASGGFACPRCHCRRFAPTYNGRRLWECLECRYQCSSIAGTVFQDTKLPLTTWFLAIYCLSQNKQSISGLELKRLIGVSYRTAWMLKHKLTQTMCERESERRLSGRVEIDDAFLGGERPGRHGRGDTTKSGFVAAVATNGVGRRTHVPLIWCPISARPRLHPGPAAHSQPTRRPCPMVGLAFMPSVSVASAAIRINAMSAGVARRQLNIHNFAGSTRYCRI